MVKRCKFCARKLNNDGCCSNLKCPDNLRHQIINNTVQTEAKNTTKS